MKRTAILIDLDGTLVANSERALAHIERSKANLNNSDIRWDEFFEGSENIDFPNWWCLELIKAMSKEHDIIFLTGRQDTETTNKATRMWLGKYIPAEIRYDLYMRDRHDFRKNEEVKYDLLKEEILPHHNILFAIDDMKVNINLFRKMGIPALHCADY